MKSLYRTILTFALLLGVSFLLPGCSRTQTVHYVPTNMGQPMYNGQYPPFHSNPNPRYGYRRAVIVHHVVHHTFTPARRSR